MFAAVIVVLGTLSTLSYAFIGNLPTRRHVCNEVRSRGVLSMEYIPDGLTKKEWDDIKRREAEELKKKGNLGALGPSKFKSRSFEAWQKAGAKHLFPVDPKSSKYEERPYMQRKDGDWEGKDLEKVGKKGVGQGAPSQRLKLDDIYEGAKLEGKLDSPSIFGGSGLPWTAKQAQDQAFNPEGKQGARGVAGKKLTPEEEQRLRANLAKVSKTTKPTAAPAVEEPPKKKFLFF